MKWAPSRWRISFVIVLVLGLSLLGALCTYSSHGRYRTIAGGYPSLAADRLGWSVFLYGPFALIALALVVWSRSFRGTRSLMIGAALISFVALFDAIIPINHELEDP